MQTSMRMKRAATRFFVDDNAVEVRTPPNEEDGGDVTQLLTPISGTFSKEDLTAVEPRPSPPELRRSYRRRRPTRKSGLRLTPRSSPVSGISGDLQDAQVDDTQSQAPEQGKDGRGASSRSGGDHPDAPKTAAEQPKISIEADTDSELSDVNEDFLRDWKTRYSTANPFQHDAKPAVALQPYRPLTLQQLAERDPEMRAALAMQSYPTYGQFAYPKEILTLPPPVFDAPWMSPVSIRQETKTVTRPSPPPSKRPRLAKARAATTINGYSWHVPTQRR